MLDLLTQSEVEKLLPFLTLQEREEMDKLLMADRRMWKPLAGPQTMAYESAADELLYGGAAGGGKTDLLIGLAATQHRRGVIFRREYAQLSDMVDRSREILDGHGRLNAQALMWRDLPGDRVLRFGAMQHEPDWSKWRGRAHDFYGYDELTEFVEKQYRFPISWNRTVVPGQRCRVVCASNPPTSADGEWVIQYWAPWLDEGHSRPAMAGELRWFAVIDGKDTEMENGEPFIHNGLKLKPKSRTFVPARLADNPYLSGTDYERTLQNTPEPLRSQLMYGDWKAGRKADPWQIIPTQWIKQAQKRWSPELPRIDGNPLAMTVVGVDVARGGDDKTVIARRHWNWFDQLIKYPGNVTPSGQAVAGFTLQAIKGNPLINVDLIGVGTSAYDNTRQHYARTSGVNVGAASSKTDRSGKFKFRNQRAEAYWLLREALDPDYGSNIALPPDSELLADLAAPRWKLTPAGIQVEDKEEIKERLGRSPDCGDAVALTMIEDSLSVLETGDNPLAEFRG